MAKVIVEMEFDCEEFEDLTSWVQREVVKTVLESGAEATNTYIKIERIEIE